MCGLYTYVSNQSAIVLTNHGKLTSFALHCSVPHVRRTDGDYEVHFHVFLENGKHGILRRIRRNVGRRLFGTFRLVGRIKLKFSASMGKKLGNAQKISEGYGWRSFFKRNKSLYIGLEHRPRARDHIRTPWNLARPWKNQDDFQDPFSAHGDIGARVTARLAPELHSDWRVHPAAKIFADVFKAEVPIKNTGTMSVRGAIREDVDRRLAELADRINADVAERMICCAKQRSFGNAFASLCLSIWKAKPLPWWSSR